jgi:hypothetical protein
MAKKQYAVMDGNTATNPNNKTYGVDSISFINEPISLLKKNVDTTEKNVITG